MLKKVFFLVLLITALRVAILTTQNSLPGSHAHALINGALLYDRTPCPPNNPHCVTDTPKPPTDTPKPPTDTPKPPSDTPRSPTDTPEIPASDPFSLSRRQKTETARAILTTHPEIDPPGIDTSTPSPIPTETFYSSLETSTGTVDPPPPTATATDALPPSGEDGLIKFLWPIVIVLGGALAAIILFSFVPNRSEKK